MADSPTRTAPRIAVGSGTIACGAGLGVFLTHEGAETTGELQLDHAISTVREEPLTALAQAIDVGIGTSWAPVVLAVVCLIAAMWDRRGALVVAVTTILGWASVVVGKVLVYRQRPPADVVNSLVDETGYNSFPSGHTAFAAALVAGIILALHLRGRSSLWAWVLGIPAIFLVGASRLYLGAHYLGDVIGAVVFVTGASLILYAVYPHVFAWWDRCSERL